MHTPGPWETDGKWIYADRQLDGRATKWLIGSIQDGSLELGSEYCYPDRDQSAANARLMASASILLLTCKAVKLIINTTMLTTGRLEPHEVDKIMEVVTTAIVKAGE